MAEENFRIFVSSPSDVATERARVKLVADRLNARLAGAVRLEVLRWEDAFYSAAHSFQEAIDRAVGNMAATDIVLCIVWKRAGLKLNPAIWQRPDGSSYESGTVLEFETAIDVSRRHKGVPDVFLFRKSAPVVYEADRAVEQMEQFELLKSVWKRWTESEEGYNTAGYQSFADPDDFEVKLEACLQQWLERKGALARGPRWDRKLRGSPFRGLSAFDAGHAAVFFGRDAAIARAIAKLRQAPFLLIIGASGSGKSSLLRAGLLPRATAPGVIPDVDQWRTAIVTAGGDPFKGFADALFADDALAAELRAGDFDDPRMLAELFAAGGSAALAPLRSAVARAAQARKERLNYDELRPARLFIALDQVERLFVEVEAERVEAFARLMRGLVEAGLATLVVVLRSDTYGRFQTVPSFLALLESHGASFDLLPPSTAELEEIVTRPVAACHPPLQYEVDSRGRSLAEVLVADARGGDALPLLQMTLQRLFDAETVRGDGVLRFADYPGMDAAVARTAEEAVAGLDPAAREALPALITASVRDVAIGPEGELQSLTVVPVPRAVFERDRPPRTLLVDEFISRRLLTVEDVDGAIQVRPVHEALLRVVPAAVAIIKENAVLIRVRDNVAGLVADWAQAPDNAKEQFLVRSPALLAGAAQLLQRFGDDLPLDTKAFIEASLAADARRRDAERARQRRVLAATAAGLVVALVLAGLAGWQWRTAEEQKRIAEVQRTRAENALAAATRTADTLVFDLAQEFRRRQGVPIGVIRQILERVQGLQRQLADVGERTPDLMRLEAAGLDELASLYLDQGEPKTAMQASERARAILESLVAANPGNDFLQRELAVALNKIGDAHMALSQPGEALNVYQAASDITAKISARQPDETGLQRDYATSLNKVADALVLLGRRDEGRANYRKSLALVEALAAKDATNLQWQSDIAFAHTRLGMLAAAEGRFEEALDAYRKAAELRARIAALAPNDSNHRRDQVTGLTRIGDLLSSIGRYADAIVEYRKALTVIEALAETDTNNLQWQRDVSTIAGQIGGLLLQQGDVKGALQTLNRSLAILRKLLSIKPDNVQWLRDVSVLQNRIGDALIQDGRRDDALAAFRESLAIIEKLAAGDPKVIEWQRDLAVSLVRVGDAIVGSDRKTARALYERSRDIREKLAAADPQNPGAQRDLSLVYDRIAGIHSADGQYAEALEIYRQSLAVRLKLLTAAPPDNIAMRRDVVISYDLIGSTLLALKRTAEAVQALRAGNEIIARYAAADPDNPRWQIDLVLNLHKLASAGDQPRERYEQVLAILRKLEAAGRLSPDQKGWIAAVEEALKGMPK